MLPSLPQEPDREDGHQGVREQVRRHHRQSHGQREGHEERFRDPYHQERGYKDGQDREHRQQARGDRFASRAIDRLAQRLSPGEVDVDILDRDGRLVDEDPDRQRQPAQRHEVDRFAQQPEPDDRCQQGDRDGDDDDQCAAQVAQEEQHHQPRQKCAKQPLDPERADAVANQRRLVELKADGDVLGDECLHPWQLGPHPVDDLNRRGVGSLRHGNVDRSLLVEEAIARQNVRAILDRSNIPDVDGRAAPGADRKGRQLVDPADDRVDRCQPIEIPGANVASGQNGVAGRDGLNDLFGRETIAAQAVWIGTNDDRPLIPAKGGRGRDSRQRREVGAHPEQRQILDLAQGPCLARKDELSHRHAPGVVANDEWRDRSRRHEGSRPLDVRDDLRQCLAHVRPRMEEELDQADILDGTGLDVLDPGDIEKVVLVVGDEVALHLGGIHSSVRLRDVDDRQVEVREEVDRHPPHCQACPQAEGQHHHQEGDRISQPKNDQVHRVPPLGERRIDKSPRARDSATRARQRESWARAASTSAWATSRIASATSLTVPSSAS